MKGLRESRSGLIGALRNPLFPPFLAGDCAKAILCHLLGYRQQRHIFRLYPSYGKLGKCGVGLPLPCHDASIDRRPLLIGRIDQQFCSRSVHTLLGIGTRILKEPPLFQLRGDLEEVRSRLRAACNPCLFKRLDRVGFATLSRASLGSFYHPLRVVVAQLVELLVVGNRIVQFLEALFQIRS